MYHTHTGSQARSAQLEGALLRLEEAATERAQVGEGCARACVGIGICMCLD